MDDPPVKFIRTPQMRSLPEPPEEGDITPLWDIVNNPDESRLLVLAWMIECYRSNTPFPLLEITGEQGSAKSKTQYILRELIDPNEVNLRTNPSKTEFLFIESKNSHLVSYENLSQLKPEFQDALCTLATGGGSSVRKLYTNHEESVIHAKNPVILNGIDNLVTAQDLLDRTLTLELKRIRKRKTEEELQTQIEKSRATIFTGILHLMVDALKLVPEIKISSLKIPRMADFAILGEAIYQVSGKEEGEFLKDYRDNRRRAIIRTIESSPAILQTIRHVEGLNGKAFYGSYAQLLREIESYNYPDLAWPKSPKGLGSLLKRFAPSIRQLGFNVEFDQKRSMDGYKVSISQFDSECAENITDEIEEEDTIPFE